MEGYDMRITRQTITTERGGRTYWRGRVAFVVRTYSNGHLLRETYTGGTMTEAREIAAQDAREAEAAEVAK